MPQIRRPLYWDEDDENINHLWVSHQVDPIEFEEMLFGSEGEDEPQFLMIRDGEGYVVLGQTPNGRFLKLYGESSIVNPMQGLCSDRSDAST